MNTNKKRVTIIFFICIILGVISLLIWKSYVLTIIFLIVGMACNNYINNYLNNQGGKYND